MNTKTELSQFHQVSRQNDLLQEQQHNSSKTQDARHIRWIACSNCAAVYQDRRKQSRLGRAVTDGKTCPKCHRTASNTAVGFLILQGDFFLTHRKEVRQMILDLAERERNKHPQKRIIDVKDDAHITLITTSDIDFTRKIGDALHATYQGCLSFIYSKEKSLIDVSWEC